MGEARELETADRSPTLPFFVKFICAYASITDQNLLYIGAIFLFCRQTLKRTDERISSAGK